MTDNEIVALLRLQCIPNIGAITAKKLIQYCGSPTAIFKDKRQALLKIEGVGDTIINHLFNSKYLRLAEAEHGYIRENNIDITSFSDSTYPKALKHCVDAPILLFKRGNIQFKERKLISIVGTRNITSYGRSFCEALIADLATLNPIIVSGFAYGVDICVQKAAVKHGLQTIGCLAHGLNQIYPKAHAKYVAPIEENGGFLTEFWSTSQPERENFLKRNRIIAGLSEATIVVESAYKGGSLVTADLAHGYHRDVFAVPGRTNDTQSIGCNNLIKQQKAHMLTSAADLIYIMGWEIEEQIVKPAQQELFVSLNDTEERIYEYLKKSGRQILDHIALDCSLPIFKTSSSLLKLEMKGVVRPLPGKSFEAL